ncbi:hypothetical protein SynRS9907_02019 [Synechococcus sp. RS9907]|nr:hypothetical protein SynRS9907_02019 [Synechococcus sp. RS9907]
MRASLGVAGRVDHFGVADDGAIPRLAALAQPPLLAGAGATFADAMERYREGPHR